MANEELLDEERVETDLEENDQEEYNLDDIDLIQLEEEENDYKQKYEKLLADHDKMRKAFVAQKKSSKKAQKSEPVDDIDAKLDARLEMRDFYKNNPDASEYKEEIEAYQKKGISRDDALTLISMKASKEKKSAEPNVVGRSRVNKGFGKVSSEEYMKMSPSAQKAYMKASTEEFGELVFTS